MVAGTVGRRSLDRLLPIRSRRWAAWSPSGRASERHGSRSALAGRVENVDRRDDLASFSCRSFHQEPSAASRGVPRADHRLLGRRRCCSRGARSLEQRGAGRLLPPEPERSAPRPPLSVAAACSVWRERSPSRIGTSADAFFAGSPVTRIGDGDPRDPSSPARRYGSAARRSTLCRAVQLRGSLRACVRARRGGAETKSVTRRARRRQSMGTRGCVAMSGRCDRCRARIDVARARSRCRRQKRPQGPTSR